MPLAHDPHQLSGAGLPVDSAGRPAVPHHRVSRHVPRSRLAREMIDTEYPRAMARYNRWMNERLYECCAGVPDAERKRDMGAFFKSIHGTLNHLLLADRVWLGRFVGPPFTPKSLADELYADFDELRRERARADDDIDEWIATLTNERLRGELRYTSIVNPAPRTI